MSLYAFVEKTNIKLINPKMKNYNEIFLTETQKLTNKTGNENKE